jgi:hypothetical protein
MADEFDSGALEQYPSAEVRDRIREGVDAVIAAIPGVGGSLQILFDSVIQPSLHKRQEEWLVRLGELVNELLIRDENFRIEDLIGDEAFVSAVIDASRIAERTHIQAKLVILKNCLMNLVTDSYLGDFMTALFFRYVDELQPEHFIVLRYLANPGEWFDSHEIARPNHTFASQQLLMNAAQLPVEGQILQQVLKDLGDRSLASTGSMTTTTSGGSIWNGVVSEVGRQLLQFVRDS